MHCVVVCSGRVIAIDRDFSVLDRARALEEAYGKDRFVFLRGNFGNLRHLLDTENATRELLHSGVDAIVFDLGVSMMQLSKAERGFSFRPQLNGPLDMRMDQHDQKSYTAAELINVIREADLVKILRDYSDEAYAQRIAYKICEARRREYIQSTKQVWFCRGSV